MTLTQFLIGGAVVIVIIIAAVVIAMLRDNFPGGGQP